LGVPHVPLEKQRDTKNVNNVWGSQNSPQRNLSKITLQLHPSNIEKIHNLSIEQRGKKAKHFSIYQLPFRKVIHKFLTNSEVAPNSQGKLSRTLVFQGDSDHLNPKVLLVEDEDFFRRMVAMGFEREGFTVLQADNGVDGLKVAEQERPDLIILDLVMPGLLGFEVCKALRANPLFSKTPILIMSAKSYKPDIDKALELGADAYVVKPVELDELMKIAKEQIKKRNADA
jgi:two-component system alkaline phosphatase synthesis response regulator PhoP